MFGIGAPELILILVVGLIVFGPGKLPEMGRTLGKGLREFRKASNALTQAMNAPEPPPAPPAPVQPQNPVGEAAASAAAAAAGASAAAAEKPAEAAAKAEEAGEQPAYVPPTQESVKAQIEAQKADAAKAAEEKK